MKDITGLEDLKSLLESKALKYADNHIPNTPSNMKDEAQWYNDQEAYINGVKDTIEEIIVNYHLLNKRIYKQY